VFRYIPCLPAYDPDLITGRLPACTLFRRRKIRKGPAAAEGATNNGLQMEGDS
jgi:hypothetical protein